MIDRLVTINSSIDSEVWIDHRMETDIHASADLLTYMIDKREYVEVTQDLHDHNFNAIVDNTIADKDSDNDGLTRHMSRDDGRCDSDDFEFL